MRTLDDMVRAGKILYVGVSDTPAWIVSRANTLAELRGWSRFVGLQVRYSLADRAIERDLLPMARALDLTVTAWGALGTGVLTGKYRRGESGRLNQWGANINERDQRVATEVQKVAEAIGCAPAQVALSWVRAQKGVIPILGARTLTQIQDNLGCLTITLAPEHLVRLDEASQIELGFPHDFLASDGIRDVVFGGAYALIDNHRR